MRLIGVVWLVALAWVPSASAATPSLTAETTISGISGFVDVVVERDTTLNTLDQVPAQNPSFAMEGGGAVVGVILLREGSIEAGTSGFAALRFDPQIFCGTGLCPQPVALNTIVPFGAMELARDAVLPAGRYRLQLVATGPASVTLRLPGLDPETLVLNPAKSTATEVKGLAEPGLPADNINVAGGTGQLASAGLLLIESRLQTGMHQAHVRETCEYAGTSTLPGALAFAPGCPNRLSYQGGSVFPLIYEVNGPSLMRGISGGFADPGTYSLGGNITTVGTEPKVGWAAAWIGLT